MRYANLTIFLAIALCAGSFAHDYIPGEPQSSPILLRGGTLNTIIGPAQPNSDLLFENGRITQIGAGLVPPEGTEIIDVTGMQVYPGLINGYTNVGLIEIGSVRATNDVSEIGRNNADVRAWIAYNPDSEIIPTIRSNGILTCLVVPGGSLIQGRSSLINLDGWTREDAAEKATVALHMSWPAVAIIDAWWMEKSAEEQKKDMEENRAALGRLFGDARAYWLAKQADPKVKVDARWEAMAPIFDRTLPVIIYADDRRQIDEAVAFSIKHGFRMILAGGREAWKAADLLKANGIPVIVAPTTSMPMRHDDAYDLAYRIPALLDSAGVSFCFGTFDASGARNLPFQAGNAVAYGLAKEVALRGITRTTAEILGVSSDLGTLEVGKKATIVVSSGDILDPLTHKVTHAFIQGRKVDLDNRHKELYRKYDARPRRQPVN